MNSLSKILSVVSVAMIMSIAGCSGDVESCEELKAKLDAENEGKAVKKPAFVGLPHRCLEPKSAG